ncbi:MAG: peptidoglycan editing factor PgeF [Chlamydiae bacterium CG10_big_fil_rev_8_21_14_0_10_42_34]|nr:MAG: peptidoglycan editing factor PgeF [Chlamydiae bacterium CG10_big_fil_rev_8_21_14_0_10_42_34]
MEFDKAKMQWLEFDLLESFPHVQHGVFLRHGGVSHGACSSLNVGNGASDKAEAIQTNRELIRKAMNVPKLIFPHQTHGMNVERITPKNMDKVAQADAVFTTEKNVGLGVTHADCQAAIFYDPVHEAVGVAHAGWRGLVQNIYARLLEAMQRDIGTQPQNIIVCISPSLGPDHAEYKNYKQELPQDFWAFQTSPNYFDFWAIGRKQLSSLGILDKNIEITEICTHCNEKDYFSHRREKDTGRHGTVVALKG